MFSNQVAKEEFQADVDFLRYCNSGNKRCPVSGSPLKVNKGGKVVHTVDFALRKLIITQAANAKVILNICSDLSEPSIRSMRLQAWLVALPFFMSKAGCPQLSSFLPSSCCV